MAEGKKSKDASKKKAHKEKSKGGRTKKGKKEIKAKDTQLKEQKIQAVARKKISLSMYVCGHPNIIEMFMQKNIELNVDVDDYQVNFNVYPGNNSDGTLSSGDADFYLCVYDVQDSESVEYLQKNILPTIKALNKVMAVAGLGLEYRGSEGAKQTSVDTASLLTKQFGCKGTELVSCDSKQMAVGAFSLYAAANPTEFAELAKGEEGTTEEDGGKKKKKEKKEKTKKEKPAKEKKSKKEKKTKQ
ncbi:hypothetical protein TSMEX_009314 [Taenia solium]